MAQENAKQVGATLKQTRRRNQFLSVASQINMQVVSLLFASGIKRIREVSKRLIACYSLELKSAKLLIIITAECVKASVIVCEKLFNDRKIFNFLRTDKLRIPTEDIFFTYCRLYEVK